VLEDFEQAVPQASPQTQPPSSGDRSRMARFLTQVAGSVDRYWTRTLTAAGAEEPRVRFVVVPPGVRGGTGCGVAADDNAAFYCPSDDTIYVAEELAAKVLNGVAENLPGQAAGQGRAAGDFGVAYIVAHEYAHNVQFELGFYRLAPTRTVKPFELQADCMAGLWGNAVYQEGLLEPGDVEEAINTAAAVGDFDFGNQQHHGTPEERRAAWLLGYRSGDPSVCRRFVPV
jgi:predicted metalloprotease